MKSFEEDSPYLRYFAHFVVIATFCLIGVGGLVTSHGVGLAVPDWPNTYGYNMFFFPVSQWVGGVFYEHSHRLIASLVGFLTVVLALWMFGRSARSFLRYFLWPFFASGGAAVLLFTSDNRIENGSVLIGCGALAFLMSYWWPNCRACPKYLRVLGVIAVVSVILQGVLGGLRVTWLKDEIGVFHATLAQLFLVLVGVIAMANGKWWKRLEADSVPQRTYRMAGIWFLVLSVMVLIQLVLGASMRHQHAGLAIPDFPLAYGSLWPSTSPEFIEGINQARADHHDYNPLTKSQILLHMSHRAWALLLLVGGVWVVWQVRRRFPPRHTVSKLALGWFAIVVFQACLGAATVWSNKAADVATFHVVLGAFCLVLAVLICIVAFRLSRLAEQGVSSVADLQMDRIQDHECAFVLAGVQSDS